ncbi:MAG: hypothetical protein ABJZ55_03620 [Fuerstiella sp.]
MKKVLEESFFAADQQDLQVLGKSGVAVSAGMQFRLNFDLDTPFSAAL